MTRSYSVQMIITADTAMDTWNIKIYTMLIQLSQGGYSCSDPMKIKEGCFFSY